LADKALLEELRQEAEFYRIEKSTEIESNPNPNPVQGDIILRKLKYLNSKIA
jgi:hypothetical protein